MHEIKRKIKSQKGNMVLETALIIPIILFITYFMISATLTVQHEIIMRYALDQTSKELSVIIPLIEVAGEQIEGEKIEEIWKQIDDLGDTFKNAIGDLGASLFLQNFLQETVDKWIHEGANQLNIKIPDDERQIIIEKRTDHVLSLQMNYHVYTPWTKTNKTAITFLPLWSKFDQEYDGRSKEENNDNEEDNIWSEHNFVRGSYFREKYKANLPFNYPVISGFQNGKAISIRSMDLTSPTYQDIAKVEKQLQYEIKQLANFEGSNRETKISPNIIEAADIQNRELIIVIPKNSKYEISDLIFTNMKNAANSQGISLRIEENGNSYRYMYKKEKDD
ncbi:MAG: hypothetical protein GX909_04835 [Clostridiaceae bacterium]|nr:hypothetical protein [Clostridiaceae bacterium]